MRFLALLLPVLLAAVLPAAAAGQTRPATEDLLIEWTNPEGKPWTLRARIDRPAPAVDRGRAVFLFGGGLSNDLDWTTPGRIEHEGHALQLTLSGEDARDAVPLAEALLADGWTVIRYSAIREGDPLHAQSRAMAEVMPYPGTLTLSRFMWIEVLKRAGFELGDVVALGHSLGATRAVQATEGEAAGYVFLAGAYLSPTMASPQRSAQEALAPFGPAASDGVITREEAGAGNFTHTDSFDAIDRDGSGALCGWELAAAQRLAADVVPDAPAFGTDPPAAWPSGLLTTRRPPVLAIWGGLDPTSFHGPLLEHLAQRDRIPLTTRYFATLGHNLSPVQHDRTGPIAPEVPAAIVEWLAETFPRK